MNTRLLFAASALPPVEARAILGLLCSSRRVRQITSFEQTRNRLQQKMKVSLVRVLKFAKHETLRKLHRYLYQYRPLHAQAEQPDHPDSNKILFDREQLRRDLIEMLQVQLPSVVDEVTRETLKAVGYRDPWSLPAQDTLNLIAARQNLISGVPDEIFADIQREISAGLNAGESIDQLAHRITAAFNEIVDARAELIAQTETAAAYGFASNASAQQAGVQFKQWIHSGLPKVPRPDHLAIDGLIVPMDEAYPVGDPPLMYPHDPDGSAEDVINCGCISVPATEEDYSAQESEGE
jgi:uncharacterized protein with gpF-like domain